jgi:phospholipid/cholesterol/gamma-HCH transport system ATP-binding protein
MRFPSSQFPRVSEEEILVDVESVNFAYDRRPILKGISMRVPRGKLVAIMGASGSGKTTLLRLIGGQLKPDSGTVRIAGELIHDLDAEGLYRLRRKMSMLFQYGALFTDLNVFENVAFPLREHTTLPEEMIRDLVLMKLEAVGMRGARRLRPAELSGGMARRVALARAVVLDPRLVMYDEPFAGLDPIALAVIGQLIRKLNDALDSTTIIVTHDVVESLNIVDYLYFIADGVIVGEGTPDEIRRSELPYVKQFVHGEIDGPVPFHFPARPYTDDVGATAGGAHA